VKHKIPTPLHIYALLLFVGASRGLQRGLAPDASRSTIAFELVQGAFMMALAIGILRLWRVAWIAAIIYCWLFFIVFAVVLLSWCVSPQSMSLVGTLVLTGATALHVYIYIVLRRAEIRGIFYRPAVDVKA
jgi:hypothetical protein